MEINSTPPSLNPQRNLQTVPQQTCNQEAPSFLYVRTQRRAQAKVPKEPSKRSDSVPPSKGSEGAKRTQRSHDRTLQTRLREAGVRCGGFARTGAEQANACEHQQRSKTLQMAQIRGGPSRMEPPSKPFTHLITADAASFLEYSPNLPLRVLWLNKSPRVMPRGGADGFEQRIGGPGGWHCAPVPAR